MQLSMSSSNGYSDSNWPGFTVKNGKVSAGVVIFDRLSYGPPEQGQVLDLEILLGSSML